MGVAGFPASICRCRRTSVSAAQARSLLHALASLSPLTVYSLIGVVVLSLMYAFVLRVGWRRWGATQGELRRAMPGDIYVHHPSYSATLAVTVDAPPADIWPWLVQMG